MSTLVERLAEKGVPKTPLQFQPFLPEFGEIPTQPTRADILWSLSTLLDRDLSTLRLISYAYQQVPNYPIHKNGRLISRVNLLAYEMPVEEMSIYSNPDNKGVYVLMRLAPRMGSERLKFSLGETVRAASKQFVGGTWKDFDNEEMGLLVAGLEHLDYVKPGGEELIEAADMVERVVFQGQAA